MKKYYVLLLSAALFASGCASIPVEPQAQRVLVTPNPPPKGCKYVGQVVGNQGNFFTGDFTSNKNLEQGSLNDLKNQASQMGANYVQMLTNRAGETGAAGLTGVVGGALLGGFNQTNVTATGNAYLCPNSVL